jgi:hypothetical protein
MQSFWKTAEKPLMSHAAWCKRVSQKNRRAGTSAPTLAAVWAGPVETFGALRGQPVFDGLALERIVVERESSFDDHSGPRNHDLVLYGRLANDERVVVCIEAKAGESLGETVEQYRKAGEAKRQAQQSTAAPERLNSLLQRYLPNVDHSSKNVGLLRYQLLSALAGTQAEAEASDARHAVLMLHTFLTDERPKEQSVKQFEDLKRFCQEVFDCEPRGTDQVPWCVEVRSPAGMSAKLYLAWAITDLRTQTLEAPGEAAA